MNNILNDSDNEKLKQSKVKIDCLKHNVEIYNYYKVVRSVHEH